MRARTRLVLDVALLIALVAAYRPVWTGVSLHQWLSIAIIAPLLVHVIVNWEWTIRVIRTFVERLLHMSRLNLAIDLALFLSAVGVMLSGFMVSPALVAPLGVHPTQPLLWHAIHLWTANTTLAVLAIHALAHWRWLYKTAIKFFGRATPVLGAAGLAAGRLAAGARSRASSARPARGVSRVGLRAAQAKAERAVAARTLAVVGVTAVVGLTIFAGVGLAAAVLPIPRQAGSQVAQAGSTKCPATGCTASRCHASYGKSAAEFYSPVKAKKKARRRPATSAKILRVASAASASASTHKPAKTAKVGVAPKRSLAAAPAARAKPKATKVVVAAPKPKTKRRLVCPATGCSATSCHATHGQSAASYYH